MKRVRKSYSKNIEASAINLILNQGYSRAQAARSLAFRRRHWSDNVSSNDFIESLNARPKNRISARSDDYKRERLHIINVIYFSFTIVNFILFVLNLISFQQSTRAGLNADK